MKVVKDYNRISSELKKQIPRLKPDEVVTFQMLNGKPNQDPDPEARRKEPFMFGKTQLKTQYRIYDKDLVNEGSDAKGGFVDIILAKAWSGDHPDGAICYVAGKEESRFLGKFSLHANNVDDAELFEVLFLSPEREGSPCADKSVQPLFKLMNASQESKSTISKIGTLRKALGRAAEMETEEATEIAASLNRNFGTDEELKAFINNEARERPDLFLSIADDESTSLKAELKAAFDKGILVHDHTGKVMQGKNLLTTIDTADKAELLTELASWTKSAQNGSSVMEGIRKQLKPKKQAEVVA